MSSETGERIHVSGVSELVLEVTNLEEAERFYAGILGFPVVERWSERKAFWVMAGMGTRIGLWTPQVGIAGGRGGSHVHFAMHVEEEDFPSIVRHLEAQGLQVHVEHFEGGRGDAAYVTDPDGNVVEFWSWDVSKHLAETANGRREGGSQ